MHDRSTITLGVAAIRRKLYSDPMRALLTSLITSNSSISIILLDEGHMDQPVSQWPIVDVLLPLHSSGFPLETVLQYVELRSPLLINNLYMQRHLMDRREIRRSLETAGVPIPPAICVDRTAGDHVSQTGFRGNTLVVHTPATGNTFTLHKPFVEKPVNPDDHNVYVYYKDGGVRKLFRKVKNLSSAFYPEETQVRQNGNYVYEQFFEPYNRADVKVYGVGKFFHAESRKAPHIDGIVERDARGRERRDVVSLSSQERAICQRVSAAFDQYIIGFDLLRCPDGESFIIDVNGWSLVKNSMDYPVRAGKLLADYIVYRVKQRDQRAVDVSPHSMSRSSSQKSSKSKSADLFESTQSSSMAGPTVFV